MGIILRVVTHNILIVRVIVAAAIRFIAVWMEVS